MSESLLKWPAPAKLNLLLHITGRRKDGYHLLQTVFQFLDYSDYLGFEVLTDKQVRRAYALAEVPEDQDLCVRAARLLQKHAGVEHGALIHLDKKLPMGGGLGGGSSDAAAVLLVLNKLWDVNLPLAELATLGLSLGADVPVFIQGHAAWAEGVGENLQPVDLPEAWFLVICPPVTVSTAEIFSSPELIRDCPPITIRDFLTGQGGNVCEAVARSRYPQVEAALNALGEYGPARMTGTGACVYTAFETEAAAQTAWQQLTAAWPGFIARGRNVSPLHTLLNAG